MKIGIFAKTFSGSDPDLVLGQCRTAGFEGVQYNMACSGLASMPDEIPVEAAEAVARASSVTGQAVFAVSGTYNMIHPDPAVRRDGERRLSVIAGACKAMGAPLVTLCTGTRDVADQWRHHPDNGTPEAWRDLLASMEIAVRIAEENGIRLGIEPETANVVNSAAAAHRLLMEMKSQAIGVVLDPANLLEHGDAGDWRAVVEGAVDLLSPYLVMAHAKDRARDGSVAAPGKGNIDFQHFLSRLLSAGFDGPLVAHGFGAAEAAGVSAFLKSVRETVVS